MCLPLLERFESRYPDAELHLLAPRGPAELLQGYGTVHQFTSRRDSNRVARSIRGFDLGVSISGSWTTAINLLMADCRRRVGPRREARLLFHKTVPLPPPGSEHIIQNYLRLDGAAELTDGIPEPRFRIDLKEQEQLLRKANIDGGRPYWILAPFAAYGPAKELPLDRWEQLARRLSADGCTVVIAGTADERNRLPDESFAGCVMAFGMYGLREWAIVMSGATGMVGNDSGLTHMAAAAGTRTTVGFFSTTPKWSRPIGPSVQVLYRPLDCSPCHQKVCPLGTLACMDEWPAGKFVAAVTGQ